MRLVDNDAIPVLLESRGAVDDLIGVAHIEGWAVLIEDRLNLDPFLAVEFVGRQVSILECDEPLANDCQGAEKECHGLGIINRQADDTESLAEPHFVAKEAAVSLEGLGLLVNHPFHCDFLVLKQCLLANLSDHPSNFYP